jgi:hypothetical protein
MIDPTLQQAVGFAQWYMLRGATDDEVTAKLQLSGDYDWLTDEERKAVIAAARRGEQLTQAVWAAYPHLRAELTDYKMRRKRHRGRGDSTRPHR